MKVIKLIKRPTTYAVVLAEEYNILGLFKIRIVITGYNIAKDSSMICELIAEEVAAWIELNDIPEENIDLDWFAKYVKS